MDICNKTYAEGVDNVARGEITAFIFRGNRQYCGKQESDDAEEESTSHSQILVALRINYQGLRTTERANLYSREALKFQEPEHRNADRDAIVRACVRAYK